MYLVTGISFGNVVRLTLVFSNGSDFGFGVVQSICGYANRLSEASKRDSIPAAASNFTFFMVFILLTFMVESVVAFDGLIISLLTITRVAKSAI